MIGTAFAWWIGRVIQGMRFPGQAEGAAETSNAVLSAFGRGAAMGLRNVPYPVFKQAADALPWNRRAFFHEGHAMGVAGRSAMRLRSRNPETFFPGPDFAVMRYVGFGFWNGACTRYPAPRLREDSRYWVDTPLYDKYRLLMYNGLGFADVMFSGAFRAKSEQRVLSLASPEERDAALHGVGRVLWFLYMNNYPVLQAELERHAEHLEALGIGLGLAIGFTQAATPERILRSLDQFPDTQRRVLQRGVGIALEVHASNEAEGRRHIEQFKNEELRRCYDIACNATAQAGHGTEWYRRYHELTAPAAAIHEPAGAETHT